MAALRRTPQEMVFRVNSFERFTRTLTARFGSGPTAAGWKDQAGRLWFPTIEGLASVDPSEATDIPGPPPVTVDEIVVDGESRAPAPILQVGPGRPNVEFRYTGVSLSAPDNVTFRYR